MDTVTDAAVRRAFDRLMELRPADASYLGLHQYDDRLPGGGLDDVEAEIEVFRELHQELVEAPESSLDHDLALQMAELNLFQIDELRTWESLPDAPEQLASAIFLSFAREYAPLPERLRSIAARLEDAPRFLERSRETLRRPVRIHAEIAIDGATEVSGLIDAVVVAAPDEVLRARLDSAGRAAKEAIAEHVRWIREEVLPGATENVATGEERFRRLLQLRRLPDTPEDILALGHRYLDDAKRLRQELVAERWPGRDLDTVHQEIESHHAATFEGALAEYRETIGRSRDFIYERGLATLPEGDRLDVIETPAFLRAVIPFAAYEPAAHFDAVQHGIYIVTPPRVGEGLGQYNRADITNTSVHEGYPGHHLQFVSANRNPSLARLMSGFQAHEFIEGWAHYCEQMMFEEGFSAGPEVRFVQLTDMIWRACRIIIDCELSQGRMGFDEAVSMLVREAGMTPGGATAEVRRYTYTPGYQLSYLYGKHLLLELREAVRRQRGEDFSLREFHDTLLSAGSLPAAFWGRLFT